MPNHVECCTYPVLEWIAEHLPEAPVNVMAQFHPDNFCDPTNVKYRDKYAEIARRPTHSRAGSLLAPRTRTGAQLRNRFVRPPQDFRHAGNSGDLRPMAKLLVIGASRGIGLETVKAALRAGHNVRALARSAGGIAIQDPALDKVSGNALDSETVRDALEDVDAVIQTLGVDISPRAIFERTTLFSQSTRILVDAMKAAGVKRLIAVTGLGAGNSRGHGSLLYDAVVFPLLLKRVYDDKDVQEWIIRSSGLDWTIVRPGLLTNRTATGHYRVLTGSKDWRFGGYQSCRRRGLPRPASR